MLHVPTRLLLQTRSYDEKCQFGLTCFFSRKELNRVGIFLVIWPHRESIQSVITKVEIIPLFHGYSIYLFEPFVKEKNDGASSNREATIFFSV